MSVPCPAIFCLINSFIVHRIKKDKGLPGNNDSLKCSAFAAALGPAPARLLCPRQALPAALPPGRAPLNPLQPRRPASSQASGLRGAGERGSRTQGWGRAQTRLRSNHAHQRPALSHRGLSGTGFRPSNHPQRLGLLGASATHRTAAPAPLWAAQRGCRREGGRLS